MKNLFCILISIFLLISFTACANEQDKTLESATALMTEGKYQEAYDALTAQEGYAAYQEQVELAKAEIDKAKGTFLMESTWKETDSALELCFLEGGALQFDYDIYGWNEEEPSAMWSYENGVLKVSRIPDLELEDGGVPTHEIAISEENGVVHLTIDELDFVREADYGPYEPEIVHITNDNWTDYFEIRDEFLWYVDENDNCTDVKIAYGIAVREAYADRVRADISNVYISCTYDIDIVRCSTFDLQNRNVVLGNKLTNWRQDHPVGGRLVATQLWVYGGTVYNAPTVGNTVAEICKMENFNMVSISGVLMLRPE